MTDQCLFCSVILSALWNELVGVKVGASVVSGRNPLKDQLTFVAGPPCLWCTRLKAEHNEEIVTLGNVDSLIVFCQFTGNDDRQLASIAIIAACQMGRSGGSLHQGSSPSVDPVGASPIH